MRRLALCTLVLLSACTSGSQRVNARKQAEPCTTSGPTTVGARPLPLVAATVLPTDGITAQVALGPTLLHPTVRTIVAMPGEHILLRRSTAPTAVMSPDAVELRVVAPDWSDLRWRADRGAITRLLEPGADRYTTPRAPGTYRLRLTRSGTTVREFRIFVLTPFARKQRGYLAGYRIGNYPQDLGLLPLGPRGSYQPVRGFVAVTRENHDTELSAHFRLRDFLCKDESAGFPKFVVLDVRLLDKLERLIDALRADGVPATRLTVMSGYRTPHYNRQIGNDTIWSRHTMGDAADVFVDEDGDGVMDDLDRDGFITRADAEVLLQTVERLDACTDLAGGAAAYAATDAHGPFVHVDVRGYRARW
jgi:hypothetical protein